MDTNNKLHKNTDDTDNSKSQPVSVGVGKEVEMPNIQNEPVKSVLEHEVPKEVANHVKLQKNTVEIPPDLKQVGVTNAPQDQTITSVVSGTSSNLPLTDDQIGEGLSEKPTSSFRWLSEWCFMRLKQAHMHLKKIHGHFIRVKDI